MQFKLGEINIICTDLVRSLKFYRDLLGFEVVGEEDGALHMKCQGSRFLLLPFAKPAPERKAYCKEPAISFDLIVDDLGAAYDYFKQNKVEFEMEPEVEGSYFFIRDPDGLVIEIVG